jgi:xanthine dehydrogenase YagR molybdenum-binding subunit
MRDGAERIGWGMATACFPAVSFGATVRARLVRDGEDVRAVITTAGIDVGTGMYTMLALTAAEHLGLPLDRVSVELGDSQLPRCPPAGGSNLTASTAPAVAEACADIRRQLAELAVATSGGKADVTPPHPARGLFGWFRKPSAQPRHGTRADGRVAQTIEPTGGKAYAQLLARAGRDALEAEGSTQPIWGENDEYTFHSFGAHFVEVRAAPDIGRVRVTRVVSVFDVGRVLNAKATRSQFYGGIVFGIGQALLEELVYDRAHGQSANADLAGYLVPVSTDVPQIDVSWIDEPDLNFNSLGCRGVGEIGITGVAAAIANAVYHATGVRVRDLPITPDKLL